MKEMEVLPRGHSPAVRPAPSQRAAGCGRGQGLRAGTEPGAVSLRLRGVSQGGASTPKGFPCLPLLRSLCSLKGVRVRGVRAD